jgi:flagellar motility protein MotE (MotC chaperone)
MAKLKVFRTSSGFHDSFVAAPSRAAALRAWGANTDLFAFGAAEQVTDAKLMAEPLAKPGTIVKRSRGSAGEHLSAAGTSKAKKPCAKSAKTRKAKPPPSRATLDEADRRLAEAELRYDRAREELDEEAKLLDEKRRKLQRKHEAEIEKQRAKHDAAAKAYKAKVRAWQEATE